MKNLNKQWLKSFGLVVTLMFTSSSIAAGTSPVAKLKGVSFQADGVLVSLKDNLANTVTSDPDSCGNNKHFLLKMDHVNYDVLSAAFLTYYFHQSSMTLSLDGCSATIPVVTAFVLNEASS